MESLIVKRVSDLSKLRTSKEIYWQKSKDYESEGEPMEGFSTDTQSIIGTKQNLTPHWDRLKDQWSFHGGLKALLPIAERLQLTDKEGKIILPTENSLRNRLDPFFAHKTLWMSEFIEESTKVLTDATALQEFYMRVMKGREDIVDHSREDKQSVFETSRGKLEISSPQDEQVKKAKVIDEEAEAWELFISLKQNFDKLKRLIAIADPPSFNESYNDQQALAALVRDEFVTNDTHVTRYGTTARKYFIYLANLNNEDLEVYSKVMAASRMQIIRRNTSEGYTFQQEKLNEGLVRTDKQLVEFFKDDANISYYRRMEKLIEEKDKLING
jgi:hypothetical protein